MTPRSADRPVAELAWPEVLAWRQRRQHLEARAPRAALLDVVADVAGLHAQVFSSAVLTLWARVEGLERDAVATALWEERTLMKTWAMRGTLHLLPAAELPTWVGAQGVLKPRHHAPSWLRAFGLTREEAEATLDAIPQVLEGRTLTRAELAEAVAERTGAAHLNEKLREGFGSLLKPAAFRGDLCFAPSAGPEVRFARPADWLGPWAPLEPDAAMAEVLRRYLAAYGPAAREDFARWFGMTSPAHAGRLIAALGDEVVPVAVEGRPVWMLAAHLPDLQAAAPRETVRLLPAFDHYVVAAPRDQDAVVPAGRKAAIYRPQGWLSPVLLVDGRMAGLWRHEARGGNLRVSIEPFEPLSASVRRKVEGEAERLAGFLGGRVALDWS
jgi:hypothetical protein